MFRQDWCVGRADIRGLWPGQGSKIKFWAECTRLKNEWRCVTKINRRVTLVPSINCCPNVAKLSRDFVTCRELGVTDGWKGHIVDVPVFQISPVLENLKARVFLRKAAEPVLQSVKETFVEVVRLFPRQVPIWIEFAVRRVDLDSPRERHDPRGRGFCPCLLLPPSHTEPRPHDILNTKPYGIRITQTNFS